MNNNIFESTEMVITPENFTSAESVYWTREELYGLFMADLIRSDHARFDWFIDLDTHEISYIGFGKDGYDRIISGNPKERIVWWKDISDIFHLHGDTYRITYISPRQFTGRVNAMRASDRSRLIDILKIEYDLMHEQLMSFRDSGILSEDNYMILFSILDQSHLRYARILT